MTTLFSLQHPRSLLLAESTFMLLCANAFHSPTMDTYLDVVVHRRILNLCSYNLQGTWLHSKKYGFS